MRGYFGKAAAFALCAALITAAPAYSADIGDFLTGGSGTQSMKSDGQGNDSQETSGDAAGNGDEYTGAASASSSAPAQSLSMVTCTDPQTGINVARAVVPEGYNVSSETIWCGPIQSPDYPAEVFVDAKSPDGSIQLTYESPVEFVQILNASVNGMQFMVHQDWSISTDYYMMMLTYMNAQQYCDYVSQNCMPGCSGMTFVSEEPLSGEAQQTLQQSSQQTMNKINQLLSPQQGIYVDYAETTAAERTYRYTDPSGKAKILVISCVGQALRMVENVSGYGMGETNITNLIWSIPGRYCLMVDEDRYEEGMEIFKSFCSNTTISDQFKKAMADLSQSIMTAVANARATSISSLTDNVRDSFSSELSGGDDTYSGTEAWDDAILDRNDYTLSSGDSVKVDTSYDYVYEMPDGSVYATNSALDEPAGSTRLYAN